MAAYFLLPAIREAVRPAARGAVRGAMVAGDRFRSAMSGARESLEDIVAEAQFDRMKHGMDPGQMDDSVEGVAGAIQPRAPGEH